MKKLLAVLIVGISAAYAQVPTINSGTSGVTAPTGTTVIHNMWDDGHVNVPLQFGFPYFGKTFTNSVMYDNGVVGFFAPATTTTQAIGCDPATMGYCGGNNWYSQQFTTNIGPSWNYMIAPLHTDMRPVTGSVYSTTGDVSQMTYRWQNVGEYYNPSNLNTFSLQIKPSGFIGVDYEKINIGQSNVSVGLVGDASKGEYVQHYWKQAGNQITTGSIPNWNILDTGAVDPCVANPLSSPSCSGYAAAYQIQQCSINPLFAPSCPGYQQAYFTQQCSTNPLYSTSCPGYASAYLDYQCSIDPLYSTTCQGYQQAYHNQQCSINPLYATTCTGYAEAYKSQQCSLNGLYDTTCPNYAEAYFVQQCSINGLYDTKCPNYATAYATAEALKPKAVETTTTTTTTTSAPPPPTMDSSGELKVAVVADTNVNTVITQTATSASPAQAATATVPLVAPPATQTTTTAQVEAKVEAKQDAKEEKNASSNSVSSTTTASSSSSSDSKPAAPTARQELQARREAAAKAKAVEDGKNLASNMGKAADMEQQKAVQNVVIQAMGFTPGFDVYSKTALPDVKGYKPYAIYTNQKTIDNRANLRMFGGTDRLHSEMVDSQYNRGN